MTQNILKKFKNRLFISTFLILILFLIGLLTYIKLLEPIAKVNGESIAKKTYMDELEKQAGKRVLDGMITRTLVYQIAKNKKITVSDKEVEEEIKKIEISLKEQKSTLEQVLQSQNMTKSDLNDRVKLNRLSQKLVEKSVTVSDKEVEEYISSNPGIFENTPVTKEIKNQIKEQIKQQKMSQKIEQLITDTRKKSNIDIYLK